MSIDVILIALSGVISLIVIALCVIYPTREHDLDHVILMARKIDLADLEALFDPAQEWQLRSSLTPPAFREAQEGRVRVLNEFLRRISHNASLIQRWLLKESRSIRGRELGRHSDRDLLVAEALQLGLELRFYCLIVGVKAWLWIALRTWRFQGLLPHLCDLRVQGGVNVVEKYQKLTALAMRLSAGYGSSYQDRLVQVLTT